jgi:large subunit ribosomal protein L5
MASKEVRLKAKYREEVGPALTKKFGYANVMAVPRLEKIVVNVGVGDALQNIKLLDVAAEELAAITGQKPIINRARRSIAAFKLREGNPIGTSVTLRSSHMYEFLDRLISIALPRVRDFRGVPTKSFDGRGNYTLGLKDQLVFLEINYSKVEQVRGMNITIVTTARTDEESQELLRLLGMPFRKAAA